MVPQALYFEGTSSAGGWPDVIHPAWAFLTHQFKAGLQLCNVCFMSCEANWAFYDVEVECRL